jgi:hypothetical protein
VSFIIFAASKKRWLASLFSDNTFKDIECVQFVFRVHDKRTAKEY